MATVPALLPGRWPGRAWRLAADPRRRGWDCAGHSVPGYGCGWLAPKHAAALPVVVGAGSPGRGAPGALSFFASRSVCAAAVGLAAPLRAGSRREWTRWAAVGRAGRAPAGEGSRSLVAAALAGAEVAGAAPGSLPESGSNGADKVVDMRSDTVTQPTEPMRQAMAAAAVGDDVFGDDPTVKELEAHVASMLGKPAGLFVASGTMGNLIAVGVHCSGRGEEVICGKESHTFIYEQGGASSLMGAVLNTIPNQEDGTLKLEDIRKVIKPDDEHFAAARLVIIENTQNKMGGCVLPVDYMNQVGALCKELNLAYHVDGARLWNAAAALGVPIKELVAEADSVTVCLSKGLGAPVGSVLAGSEAFIKRARRLRKALGGGMRQVGVLAAAGLYAVKHNFDRLSEDHANAQRLAKGLSDLGLKVVPAQSNMVFFDVDDAPARMAALQEQGMSMLCLDGKRRCRAVCHLHITAGDVDRVLEAFASVLKS